RTVAKDTPSIFNRFMTHRYLLLLFCRDYMTRCRAAMVARLDCSAEWCRIGHRADTKKPPEGGFSARQATQLRDRIHSASCMASSSLTAFGGMGIGPQLPVEPFLMLLMM